MSLFDYQVSRQIAVQDPPFAALIMAAYRKADTSNALVLAYQFPVIIDELQARYDAPGGLLDHEQAADQR
jgi:hypothetical protein